MIEAKERRDDAERVAVHQIAQAGDHAVKPSSIWESIQDSATWQTLITIATVVLTIVSIVAIFVSGPLVWALIIAATALLLVNALMSIAQGKDAWGELAMLAIGLIPGGRLLGLAAHGVEAVGRMGVAGERLTGAVEAVGASVRSGGRFTTTVSRLLGGDTPQLGDVASVVTGGTLKAVHAGSAAPGVLARVFQENYGEVIGVNSERWAADTPGFDSNCTRCVIATDHTIAGAPSSAMPLFTDGDSIGVVADHFYKSINDFSARNGYDSIVEAMTDLGAGSRGIVMLERGPDIVGHVFNVVNDRGIVAFIDGQTGGFATLDKFEHLFLLITAGAR